MRNRSSHKIKLILIRHGATPGNLEKRYIGTTEEDVSFTGTAQLMKYKEKGLYPMVDCLYTSSMKRCRQTAEILYPDMEYQSLSDFNEIDFGLFEGRNHEELDGNVAYQNWIDSGGRIPFPNGESRESFILRVQRGFQSVIDQLPLETGDPFVLGMVVHGGTIMALLSSYGQGEYFDFQVKHGRGYICEVCETQEGILIRSIQLL